MALKKQITLTSAWNRVLYIHSWQNTGTALKQHKVLDAKIDRQAPGFSDVRCISTEVVVHTVPRQYQNELDKIK